MEWSDAAFCGESKFKEIMRIQEKISCVIYWIEGVAPLLKDFTCNQHTIAGAAGSVD